MNLYVPVGQIVSAHGIKGEVRFRYYNEVYQDFFRYTSLYYDSEGKKSELRVKKARLKDRTFILQFEEIEDRGTAERLKGKILYVKKDDLPELQEGEYYYFQIIGLHVKNEEGKNLGKVCEIISTGPHEVLVIKGKKELLVPMVEEFVTSINLEAKVITIKTPEYI